MTNDICLKGFWPPEFIWPGEDEIDYKGMINKKKISAFLRDLGVLIE